MPSNVQSAAFRRSADLGHSATVRLRSDDGVARIGPATLRLPALERRLALCCLLLFAGGLFVAGLAPVLLLAGIALACAVGEGLLLVDQLVQRRRPLAEVRELPRRY